LSLAVLGCLAAAWAGAAAVVPQGPALEIGREIGGAAFQISRLFGAHDAGLSWLTWLLAAALVVCTAGFALRVFVRRSGASEGGPAAHTAGGSAAEVDLPSRALPLLGAAVFGFAALASAVLVDRRGRAVLVEGADDGGASFAAEILKDGRADPVQLPFALDCDAETEDGLPCRVLRGGRTTAHVTLGPPGSRARRIGDISLSRSRMLPAGGKWARLGPSTRDPVAADGEILVLRRPGGSGEAQLATVATYFGTLAVALEGQSGRGYIGADSRALATARATSLTRGREATPAPLGVEAVRGPQRHLLVFREGPGTWLAVLSLAAAVLLCLLGLRNPSGEEQP